MWGKERWERGKRQCSTKFRNFPCKSMLTFLRILKFVNILFLLRPEILKNQAGVDLISYAFRSFPGQVFTKSLGDAEKVVNSTSRF